jgi:hypothetical protein
MVQSEDALASALSHAQGKAQTLFGEIAANDLLSAATIILSISKSRRG